ncbi:serine/threonine-protein kinase [Gemmatimonadota bacterium]
MVPIPDSHRKALGDRYTVEREIGQGGMATVYLARDNKHGREVAIKILLPELSAAVGPDRFLREIEITARLNHPHVLPLLDSGVAGGVLYYVMPFVAGGSLRRLLKAQQRIPLEEVLRITRDVASALDHAHGKGVIHRDIKPENILFSEGLAVVSDFGIARAVSDTTREGVTRTGLAIGTPGYMSPEQALGTAELDERSDVYSLGCVVYEMLTGGTPASWPGPEDVRLGRLTDLPADHRRRLDALHGRVEQVLTKALALRPGDRFLETGELANALISASQRTPSFNEHEVRQLLDRASEIETELPDQGPALTMGGVEQVAAQVGIPPEHVRRAASELDPQRGTVVPTVGGKWRKEFGWKWDRLVADAIGEGEAPEAAFAVMVDQIQQTLGVVGLASVIGGTLTWSPAAQTGDTRKVVVSVTPRRGQTTIHIEETLEIRGFKKVIFPVGGISGGAFGALIAEGLGFGEPLGPLFALACAVGGLFAASFTTTKIDAGERGPQLQALSRRLAEIGEDAAKGVLGEGAGLRRLESGPPEE